MSDKSCTKSLTVFVFDHWGQFQKSLRNSTVNMTVGIPNVELKHLYRLKRKFKKSVSTVCDRQRWDIRGGKNERCLSVFDRKARTADIKAGRADHMIVRDDQIDFVLIRRFTLQDTT